MKRILLAVALILAVPALAVPPGTQTYTDDVTVTGTIAALNNVVGPLTITGEQGAGLVIPVTSTLVAVLTPYCSLDNSTWTSTYFITDASGSTAATLTTAAGTAYQVGVALIPGCRYVQVKATGFTGGTTGVNAAILVGTQNTMVGNVIQGASTPSDTSANPTNAVPTQSHLMGWNPGTSQWERVQTEAMDSDAESVAQRGIPAEAYGMMYDPGANTWARQRGDTTGGLWTQDKTPDTVIAGTNLTAACATPTAACGAGTSLVIPLAAKQGAGVTFTTGCTATMAADVSLDGGTTWSATYFDAPNGAKTSTVANPATASVYSIIPAGGASHVRVRVSAYTSTCTVSGRASVALDPSVLFAANVGVTTAPPAAVQMGGWNATNTSLMVPSVKATAPLSTDNALVVAISQNSPAHPVWLNPAATSTVSVTPKVVTVNTTTNVKASAGNVYGLSCANANASVCWVQFYNTAGSPTCGTAAVWAIALPASGVVNIPPGAFALGNFATGIGMCMGTTATGATACTSANSCTIFYQ